MKREITVPPMGESVTEATVANILTPSGSYVAQDQEILELETDKVNQVLYSPKSGVIQFQVKVGQSVKIGEVIGDVDTEGNPSASPPLPNIESKPTPATPPPTPPSSQGGSARIMPQEFVSSLQAPPPAVTRGEPQKLPPPPQGGTSSRKKMSSLRKVIATRLVQAKNETAMLTTFNEVDMSSIIEIRNKEKDSFQKAHGVKLGFMSFFIKGIVAALQAVPEINAYIDQEEIVTLQTYDLSVAVSTERGLLVPVIRGCDQLTFPEIEKALEIYAKKAREGTISVDDLKGGSFTLTNGGVFGSLLSTPILNPPQSAILGMHAIIKRPVVVADQIVIRPMMYLALSYDHRIVDGKEAVLFLVHLKQTLEEPSRLLLDL